LARSRAPTLNTPRQKGIAIMTTTQAPKAVAAGRTTQDQGESPRVVRLSVNLASSVADALKSTAQAKGLSITEAIRHAIAIWKLVSDEQAKGNRVMIVEGRGEKAEYREIVIV
jgi:hypothetical protein